MAVHVWHLLVHEGRPAAQGVFHEHAVLRLVQIVVDGTLAQFHRLARLLVHEVVGVHQLAGLRVVHVQFAAHEHIVHLGDVRVVRFIRKHGQTQYQLLGLVIHLPRALVAELATDEAAVSFAFVLVYFLPEPQRTRRQRVSQRLTHRFDGISHLVPVILLAHQLPCRRGTIVQLDTSVQHARVRHILLDFLGIFRQVNARLLAVMEKRHGFLVSFVVLHYPQTQVGLRAVGVEFLDFFSVIARETIYNYQCIVARCTATATGYVHDVTVRPVLVVCFAHNTTIHQLTNRYTPFAFVVLHRVPPLP